MKMKPPCHESTDGSSHVCPWWLAYTFDNPIRRWLHRPRKLLAPYVKEGMHVIDVGCGMGVFTIAMAKKVGDSGRVTALDLQEKMLEIVRKRSKRAGVEHRIQTVQGSADQIDAGAYLDFALAFWMVHEISDRPGFFQKISTALKPGGLLLMAEPAMHVSRRDFERSVEQAATAGLLPQGSQPKVRMSLSTVLVKQKR
jgi:ubiquinone/menaquinone biosynthesis C-methylase UbiE